MSQLPSRYPLSDGSAAEYAALATAGAIAGLATAAALQAVDMGLVRLLQEVGTVPGVLCWQHGWLTCIQFDPLHPLARVLQRGFAALFRERVVVRCLR